MDNYADGYFHDAADDVRASYEAHPVDEMEPEHDHDPSEQEQQAASVFLRRVFEFMTEPIKSRRHG